MDGTSLGPAVTRHRIWRWLKYAYATAVAVTLLWSLWAAWPALQAWPIAQLLPGAIALGFGWLLMVFCLGRGWAGAMRAWSGLHLLVSEWVPLQAAAWSGRYLPGKLGLLAGKLQLCQRGPSWRQVTGSVISEQLAFVLAGLSLSMLALPYWLTLLPARWEISIGGLQNSGWPWLAAPIPLLLGGFAGAMMRERLLPTGPKHWAFALLGWALLAHILAGIGFHFLLVRLLDTPPACAVSIGILAAAHTAGVIALFAPAGLGVREAVISSVLAPQLGWQQALAVSALQRGLVILVDAAIAIAALCLNRQRPRKPRQSLPKGR